jgi:rSAM/selenodomain-associated transferase 1
MSPNLLIIMAKAPRLGQVKSRLARDIGAPRATTLYRYLLQRTVSRLSYDRRWQSLLAITPDAARREPCFRKAVPQGAGNLGVRMTRLLAFRRADGSYPARVIVIGSDIPGVTSAHIARAFHKLAGAEIVIGPADDGGFWLIGMKNINGRAGLLHGKLFSCVRFSSPHALQDTLRNLEGHRVALTDTLGDVDKREDLAALP